MKIRLVILLVVFAGLAVAWATRTSKPPVVQADGTVEPSDDAVSKSETKVNQQSLDKRPLPGKEMHDSAEVSVRVSVDPTVNKRRLLFELTEAHGFYVEQFALRVWWKSTPEMEIEDSPFSNEIWVEKYIPPNGTLTYCAPLVPAEIARAGGDIGTSENWGVDVRWYGRARTPAEAPNPLPVLAVASTECN